MPKKWSCSIFNNLSEILNHRFHKYLQAVSLMVITAFIFSSQVSAQAADSLAKKAKRDTIRVGSMWIRSMVLPGYGQAYNRDYYKIPIFYGGAATLAYFGYQNNLRYQKALRSFNEINTTGMSDVAIQGLKQDYLKYRDQRNLFYVGAGLVYLSSVLDAVYHHPAPGHSPGKATIMSVLVPGLGQVYNHKYWKIPLIYGGLAASAYSIEFNNRQYTRFRKAYNYLTDNNPATIDEFSGARSATELKNYRDAYRRNRDLSVIMFAGVYALNIIDANVDAYFFNFDISDNLAVRIEPTANFASVGNGYYYSVTPVAGFNLWVSF